MGSPQNNLLFCGVKEQPHKDLQFFVYKKFGLKACCDADVSTALRSAQHDIEYYELKCTVEESQPYIKKFVQRLSPTNFFFILNKTVIYIIKMKYI